jgi:hypothetical protein
MYIISSILRLPGKVENLAAAWDNKSPEGCVRQPSGLYRL